MDVGSEAFSNLLVLGSCFLMLWAFRKKRVQGKKLDAEIEQLKCDLLNQEYEKDHAFKGKRFDFAYNKKYKKYVCKKTGIMHMSDNLG